MIAWHRLRPVTPTMIATGAARRSLRGGRPAWRQLSRYARRGQGSSLRSDPQAGCGLDRGSAQHLQALATGLIGAFPATAMANIGPPSRREPRLALTAPEISTREMPGGCCAAEVGMTRHPPPGAAEKLLGSRKNPLVSNHLPRNRLMMVSGCKPRVRQKEPIEALGLTTEGALVCRLWDKLATGSLGERRQVEGQRHGFVGAKSKVAATFTRGGVRTSWVVARAENATRPRPRQRPLEERSTRGNAWLEAARDVARELMDADDMACRFSALAPAP
jgi:hypothetical protein